jgi:hypothetical protein
MGRAGQGLGPEATAVQWSGSGSGTTRSTVRLPPPSLVPVGQPGQLGGPSRWLPAPRSLGRHPLRRTRCGEQVGPALAWLYRQPEAASIPQPPPGVLMTQLWPSAAAEMCPPSTEGVHLQLARHRTGADHSGTSPNLLPWVGRAGPISSWRLRLGEVALAWAAIWAGRSPCSGPRSPGLAGAGALRSGWPTLR